MRKKKITYRIYYGYITSIFAIICDWIGDSVVWNSKYNGTDSVIAYHILLYWKQIISLAIDFIGRIDFKILNPNKSSEWENKNCIVTEQQFPPKWEKNCSYTTNVDIQLYQQDKQNNKKLPRIELQPKTEDQPSIVMMTTPCDWAVWLMNWEATYTVRECSLLISAGYSTLQSDYFWPNFSFVLPYRLYIFYQLYSTDKMPAKHFRLSTQVQKGTNKVRGEYAWTWALSATHTHQNRN